MKILFDEMLDGLSNIDIGVNHFFADWFSSDGIDIAISFNMFFEKLTFISNSSLIDVWFLHDILPINNNIYHCDSAT